MASRPVEGYGLHLVFKEVHVQKPFTSVMDANQYLRSSV